MDHESDILRRALRQLPAPDPSPEFVDRVIATATGAVVRRPRRASSWRLVTAWQAWVGAALGAAITAVVMLTVVRPLRTPQAPVAGIALAVNESRNIDVLIDSERELEDAMISIALTGGIAVDGFGDDRNIHWRTRLERGRNVLSLPVVALTAGAGRLVAVVEHDGRTRRVTIDLTVVDGQTSKS